MRSALPRLPACALAATLAAASLVLSPAPAAAQTMPNSGGAQIGVLRCDVSAGIGLIITSSRDLNCRFTDRQGRSERYVGSIRRFGLDVGASSRGVLAWSVFAPARPTRGALQGEYVGGVAGAAVGVGGAVNVLVGGSENSISLQPVSVEANRGLNFALGVGDLRLVAAPQPARPQRTSAAR